MNLFSSERASARFLSHASTLIPVLSRPVASLGHPVLQMTLKGLPRLLHLFFVPTPLPRSYRPFSSLIVPSFFLFRSLALFIANTHRARGSERVLPDFFTRVYLSGWFAESIRRNVALTGSFERAAAKSGKQVISIYEFLTGDNKFGTIAVCIVARGVRRARISSSRVTFFRNEARARARSRPWCYTLVPYLHLFSRLRFNIAHINIISYPAYHLMKFF